jgi:hypothetical protein
MESGYFTILVSAQGRTHQDLIVTADCVAASLERNELQANSEAPDKSGRYGFKVYQPGELSEIDFSDFGGIAEIKRLVEENKQLKEKLEVIESKVNTLEVDKKKTEEDYLGKLSTLEKTAKELQQAPKPAPRRPVTY